MANVEYTMTFKRKSQLHSQQYRFEKESDARAWFNDYKNLNDLEYISLSKWIDNRAVDGKFHFSCLEMIEEGRI